MQKAQSKKIAQYVKTNRRRSAWRRVVRIMAGFVVFCTTYALILPAITAEKEYLCGLESHEHSQACYIQQPQLRLNCSTEEHEAHAHGEDCYTEELQDVLICGQEPHTHTDSCLVNLAADLETPEIWEKTVRRVTLSGNWANDLVAVASSQTGYRESEKNYLERPDRGYSRYGAWHGIPYGQWDAMFASFCLHYAGIPREVISQESDSARWLETLKNNEWTCSNMGKVPSSGDLLFYRESEDAPIRVAIVLNMEAGELQIVEGDRDNQVARRKVALAEIILMGCCGVEQIQTSWNVHNVSEAVAGDDTNEEINSVEESTASEQLVFNAETENYIVTVTCGSDMILPEGTELRVSEYAKDSEHYRQRCEEAGYELEWLLNIGFFLEDEELKLNGDFVVTVVGKNGSDLGQDITHFNGEGTECIRAEETCEEGQTTVSFQTDGFSDFGGGIALAAVNTLTGFQFVTANPNQLKENTDYVIYTGNGTAYNFMSANKTSVQVYGSDNYSPYQVGRAWSLNVAAMGNPTLNDMSWRVVKVGQSYYLRSQKTGTFLKLNNGWSSLENQNGASQLRSSNVNGAATRVGDGTYHIRYENNEWKSTWFNGSNYWTEPTTIYFAEVTPVYSGSSKNYPDAVYTGDVHVDRLRFYNLCEGTDGGVSALSGCVFLIEGTTSNGQRYTTTIVSGESPQIALPANIPDGQYTITEVSAPEGYMRDPDNVREFRIENGALVSEYNIGTFLNHGLEQLTVGKTGEVEDYNNRIYQVLLEAKTNLRMFGMEPIEVLFVVDKSNSMLFPSGMTATGKTLTLGVNNSNNVNNNRAVLDSLDKSVMHYIIADPEGTSTVYAIWYDGTAWLYQDASYYAKAKFDNADGYKSGDEMVIFPGDRSYADQSSWEDATYGEHYRSNGGGLNHSMSGSTLGNFLESKGNTYTFQLYTAKDQYNRLHYLEEALANMIYELADANHENKVILIPFTKEVQPQIYYPRNTTNVVQQPVTLTTSNAEMLSEIVTHIDTSGGTRQDLALEYAYETYLQYDDQFDKNHTYTILITDGAPVRSGSSAPPLGNASSWPTTDDNGEIYGRIKGWGAKVREESTLMTIALGMEFVEGGRTVLEDIASGDEFYCALDDASSLTQSMQEILFDGMKDQGELLIDESLIVDEISDSFYPIAWTNPSAAAQTGRTVLTESNGKAWLLLQTGDWITLEGAYTTEGAANAAGQLLRNADGTYYIQWTKQRVSGSGWKGTFYVKAKEDFIGGNAIDTNKNAYITVYDATKKMETPTVNVHLLDLNENSSEVTLYLGDLINSEGSSPADALKALYDRIGFTKVQNESQVLHPEMMNRLDPATSLTDGLERNFFYLKYALGYEDGNGTWVPRDLTSDEWATLKAGGSLTFPYVYDTASSHGDVGYFTISLTKTSDTYDIHPSTVACQPGGAPLTEDCDDPTETYVLTVTYTAYELGEQGRPKNNVNNGAGSPGREVTKDRVGLNNGQGIVTSENIHEVHVISGKIVVEKIFGAMTPWSAGDTFTFLLTDENGVVQSQTVTIDGSGRATAVFDHLPRGTYTVTEAAHEDYAVKSVAVGGTTNSYYTIPDPMQVTFKMGHNLSNADVIGKLTPADLYTGYIDPVNGVYGEAIFTNDLKIFTGEIPVEKIWNDGNEKHPDDAVYMVLYLDDLPVLDTDGNARILRLDEASSWKGTFTVVLADEEDSVENYNYSVREAANIEDTALYEWYPAILENDGHTILYYDKALGDSELLGVNGNGYIVQYTRAEDGTYVVTNLKSFVMPETGGTGTYPYKLGGLLVLAAALVYGYSLRRKREGGASS